MPEYLIFFNQQWVPDYPEEDFVEIGAQARAVVAEMRAAGVLIFAAGLEERPALAHADATSGKLIVADGPYARTQQWLGGFTIIAVDDAAAARNWAGRIAVACRWPQELRRIAPGSMRG